MILEAKLIILYQRVLPHKVVLLHITSVTLCMVCVYTCNCLGCSTVVCVLHYKLFQMSAAVDLPMLFLPAEFMPKLRHVSVKKSFRVSLHVHVTLGTLHPCMRSLSPLRLEVYFDLSLCSSGLSLCTLSSDVCFNLCNLTSDPRQAHWMMSQSQNTTSCLSMPLLWDSRKVHEGTLGREVGWGGGGGRGQLDIVSITVLLRSISCISNQTLSYSHKSPVHNAIRHFSCRRCMQNVICE